MQYCVYVYRVICIQSNMQYCVYVCIQSNMQYCVYVYRVICIQSNMQYCVYVCIQSNMQQYCVYVCIQSNMQYCVYVYRVICNIVCMYPLLICWIYFAYSCPRNNMCSIQYKVKRVQYIGHMFYCKNVFLYNFLYTIYTIYTFGRTHK